ncbi:DNA primase family protein [Mycolicibacterium goodii]|uniref:DNA primase family protein n=1 Tax=Mycolicibacterium goodii TaxID=134601 RepID=UPI00256F091E|nr:phage/plasmid primase, P4 family [Mycolicibacterium goodii]
MQALGFTGVQWADPPPRRQGTEEHSGQVRMAYRLAEQYRNRLLHVHGIGWLYWDGKRWAFDERGEAKRAVLDVFAKALAESVTNQPLRQDVAKCESNNGIAGVLGVAAALLAATVADLDADPYLFNVDNGTYDLRTGELRQHDQRDRITKVACGTYDPTAPATAWPRFIDQVLPDEQVRAYLQRVAGLSLLGKVAEHILPILTGTGTGANGKGTWYGAMLFALGDYAAPADPDLFMARDGAHPTGQMDLRGRRLVVVSESDEGRRLAEATMKRLTGGDTVKARHMHRDLVEFTPSHTAFLVTNHLPKVSGDDPAVWRRLRVIPFDVVIPAEDRDPHLDEKLQAEADAVLGWAIAGWNAYRANGDKLAEPPQVLAATGDYQRDSDAVARFIDEECVTSSPVMKATTTELFNAWERWRSADGAEVVSQKAFGQVLDKRGYPAGKPSNGKRWRSGIALAVKAEA